MNRISGLLVFVLALVFSTTSQALILSCEGTIEFGNVVVPKKFKFSFSDPERRLLFSIADNAADRDEQYLEEFEGFATIEFTTGSVRDSEKWLVLFEGNDSNYSLRALRISGGSAQTLIIDRWKTNKPFVLNYGDDLNSLIGTCE